MNNGHLIALYNAVSKHSNYQRLAEPLLDFIDTDFLRVESRYELERLQYVLDRLPCKGVTVADIGGNTGYFSLELVSRGASYARLIEGNHDHSCFVAAAVESLAWQDCVEVCARYMDFHHDLWLADVDICLLLNVLHHVGDDFGDSQQSVEKAKENIIRALAALAGHARTLVFQLGFNWKGDPALPLFENGTKRELIDFIECNLREQWEIQHIGIAERTGQSVDYNDINDENIRRQDALGEFLNRPLFILRSKLLP